MMLRPEDMFGPAADPYDPLVNGSGMDREIVVWVDEDRDVVALLSAQNGDWPRLERLSAVVARIERDGMILEPAERLSPSWLTRKVGDEERKKRDARMEVIRPLIDASPAIFDPLERGRLIAGAMRRTGRARNSIKKWLLRYYANGRCANALLDRYEGCGHRRPGTTREGWRKLGRPSQGLEGFPENVTPALAREFAAATDREVKFVGEAFRISGAYERWKTESCHVQVEVDGVRTTRLHERYDTKAPATYAQFLYWYRNDGRHEKTSRKVLGTPIYEKDNRAIRSTSTNETWGPGARFQIDATVVNFGVTSRTNKNVLLGRPYLYFVRDVWSRMIVGYYLGLQAPSQITAALALLNAFTPKDAVLKSFGFDPEVDRWPSEHVCASLLHDGGELTGHWGDWLVGRLAITFEQTSGERGDLKGAVESLFQWADVEWSRTTKGRISPPRYRSKAKRNADLAAVAAGQLDSIWEFERKVIQFILDFNNDHVLTGYDADPDMLAAGVARVPTDMFEWGIANRGAPKRWDPEQVQFHMMPRERARVYPDGIHFEGRVFTTRELEPLQAEANRSGRTLPVEISYDLSGQRVLWHTDVPSGFVTCELADCDRAFRGLCFEDGKALEEARRQAEHVRRVEEDRKRAHKAHEARRERDARSSVPATDTRTVAQIRSDNAAARRSERQAERETAFCDHASKARDARSEGATIHQLPASSRPSYSVPDLDEIDDV
jgi:hypothetical protein